MTRRSTVLPLVVVTAWTAARGQTAIDPVMPTVPPGLTVTLFATEPLVRNPAAMAFDRRGRLFVGQGPQYRNPTPDTPGDSVVILIDSNGDGVADTSTTFASGLNSIQGLAWHGRDLWIGNSPDLTVVRDLDGDDVADEYVKVYTDLGNLEHANHGHTWAPDGKLYFTQGTSKGLTQPGRVAPKPFRDLWDVRAPAGTPDFPPPQVFKRGEYKATYQDPRDNWGREGGVLRADDMGANLEIVSRGFRNPWDIAFDAGFNWLGTDNDQSDGDRVFMPFFGAHFGWGHVWSNHWTGSDHAPTAPISGPVFDGSGTGIVVEGYGLLTVSTRDGKGFAGVSESETDRTLRLVQLNGESVAVDKNAIVSRRSIHQSPMPPYDGVLNARDVADLVTWLTRRGTAMPATEQTAGRAPANSGFDWELQPDRLSILYAGRRVMDYVFTDPEILRPYFQNVRAPSGAQLTRTNPPAAGDATDHAAMHPGVWLAFGDVNGEDFWRNKGRIEHAAFVAEPSLVQGRLVFATRSRLVAGNGTALATLMSRFAIGASGDHAFALTWDAEIRGDGRELAFGDQEEMGLGVRVATALTELNGGLVVNSDGVKGAKAAWGNQAAWAAYSKEAGGRIQGVAIFPSASNPNPTWWHSRDYGVIVANGFGKRALPGSADGKLVVKPGDALRLRYDVLLFDTPASAPIDFGAQYRRLQSELKPAR